MSYLYRTCLLFCVLLLASCQKDEDFTAYFGGQVMNPRTPYILFARGNDVIDTIPLDKDNRFFVKFDSLTPGMYSFKHDPDYQYIYFDKNDSITVTLNTEDFDRSIIFSGRGERKNNFMMEQYMLNDNDRHNSYDVFNLDFKQFTKSTDSIYALRKSFYEKNKKDIKWSEGFDFYAKSRLEFSYLTRKEYYPYIHTRRTGQDTSDSLPKNYYSFRKSVNLTDARLTGFSPYMRYITAMLNNMAITRNLKNGDLQENSLRDNITKLTIADSIFKSKKVKNEILNNIAFNYLLEDQNILNNRKFLERYMQLSTDNTPNNEIRKIGDAIKQLKPGSKLPAVSLLDVNNKAYNLHEETGKETVIFFWTSCARAHLETVYNKVESLKKDHPNVNFIAVNVDKDAQWKRVMAERPFLSGQHLRAADQHEIKDKWVFTKINRTIILNQDGTIKNAFTDLLDAKFAENL
jgi:peroxiredoxin